MSPARYRLLETIRAFAVNRARDAGELAGLRAAHASWWSERVEALRVTGPTDDVIAMVDANHDDLVAACHGPLRDDIELGLRLLWPLARAFQGTGRAGDAMAVCDELLAPEVEHQYPELWLRAALSASIPVSSFRGPQAFVELVTRCESRAVEMNDDYRLAVSRWLLGNVGGHRSRAGTPSRAAARAVRVGVGHREVGDGFRTRRTVIGARRAAGGRRHRLLVRQPVHP